MMNQIHHHSPYGEIMMIFFRVNRVMRAKLRKALSEYAQTPIDERSELPNPASHNVEAKVWTLMHAGVDLPLIWPLCGLIAWYAYSYVFFMLLGLLALPPLVLFAAAYTYLTFNPRSVSNAI